MTIFFKFFSNNLDLKFLPSIPLTNRISFFLLISIINSIILGLSFLSIFILIFWFGLKIFISLLFFIVSINISFSFFDIWSLFIIISKLSPSFTRYSNSVNRSFNSEVILEIVFWKYKLSSVFNKLLYWKFLFFS